MYGDTADVAMNGVTGEGEIQSKMKENKLKRTSNRGRRNWHIA